MLVKSTILDFLAILRDVFAKEPPVRSRQQEAPARLEPTSTPPPVPPLPAELGLSSSRPVQPPLAPAPTFIPPPLPPPKPFESPRTSSQINFDKHTGPPPVPPPPGRQSSRPTPTSQFQNNFTSEHHPPYYSQSYGAASDFGGTQQVLSTAQQDNRGPDSYIPTSPGVSTESWDRQPALTAQQQVQQQFLAYQENVPRSSASGLPPNLPQQPQAQFGAPTSWSPRSPQQGQYPTTEPQTLPKEQPRPAPDLLTSTGELLALLPSNAEVPVPPVPPNPEKDFLLQSIGVALYQKRQAGAAHTEASIASLSAQYGALKAASSRLQAEEDALKSLSSTLTSNEKILKESMRKAEEVMDDAKTRTVPGVDEILVAPTVVAGQLYELVAEERAINDALFVLSRAHDKRRITSDLFLRDTRTLARERFLKKALIKKIANGLGLEGAHI
ncbi:MAG: hypothetical protein M1824_005429 [Vezdaea acicularis]|nr:MAG: hypothetical protein M1824_005429 [Vezdaea acicularis]